MPRNLLKILGVSFGLAVTVGNTIGAGILRTPGEIAAALPTPWLFIGVWVIGACYALLGVNALAELGTMMPRSGAQYVYARHTFGDFAGFFVGWNDWLSTSASAAAISIVIGESAAVLFAPLAGRATLVAMGVAAAFTVLLSRGTRLGGRAQEITSLLKTLALVALVVSAFVYRGNTPESAAMHTMSIRAPAAAPLLIGLVLSAQSVIYAYDGWNGSLYFAEELRDPGREIPRSMFGGLACVGAIYILINVAFLRAVPMHVLAGSPLAAAAVAQALFGPNGDEVVRALVLVALPSAVNACLLMSSRVFYGVSRDGLGFDMATRVNAGGTPVVALWLTGGVVLLFLATGTFQTVIAIAAFYFVLNYAISFVALFVLRRREPDAERPYRAWGHPWTTGIVLAGSGAFLASAVAGDSRNSAYALTLLVVSWPVFLVMRRVRRRRARKLVAE